jgi:hypothetical protein
MTDNGLQRFEGNMKLSRLVAITAACALLALATPQASSAGEPAAGTTPAPLAVLMSCSGTVSVHHADGSTEAGRFGFALAAGDEVKTGEGATAEVLFEAGNWVQIGANSNIQIKAPRAPGSATKPEEAKKVKRSNSGAVEVAQAEPQSFEVVQNFLRLKDSEGTSALSGLRSADKNKDLIAIAPGQTKLRTTQPTFRWKIADESTELRLTVYNESGVHWQQDVSGVTSLQYPADAPALEPGVSYSWTLETTDPLAFPPLRTTASFFEVIDPAAVSAIATDIEKINETEEISERTRHFLRASLYFNKGLLDDAIAETEVALQDDPDNASLRSILARLYEEAGRSREAMATYRKIETN